MDDVIGHVVFAGGDPDLGAGDGKAAVLICLGPGPDQSQIGAALRLGQIHGAGPLTADHLRQIGLLLLLAAVGVDDLVGAQGQARIGGEAGVGGVLHFGDSQTDEGREALATVVGVGDQSRPAGLAELLIGLPESFRHGDAVVSVIVLAADAVADFVEWLQNLLSDPGRLVQDGLDQIRADLCHGREVGQGFQVEKLVVEESEIVEGSAVLGHAAPSVDSEDSEAYHTPAYVAGESTLPYEHRSRVNLSSACSESIACHDP